VLQDLVVAAGARDLQSRIAVDGGLCDDVRVLFAVPLAALAEVHSARGVDMLHPPGVEPGVIVVHQLGGALRILEENQDLVCTFLGC